MRKLVYLAAVSLLTVGWAEIRAQRVSEGLVVLYEFDEGEGLVVEDAAPGEPLDLMIHPDDLGVKVQWIPNGGLALNLGTGPSGAGGAVPVQSAFPATKIYDAIAAPGEGTNELTVEAWVRPELPDLQSNISRIVTMSIDPSNRNFTLGTTTTGDEYVHRLRAPGSDNNGIGAAGQLIAFAGSVQAGKLQHVVFTRTEDGEETLYVDNEVAAGPRLVSGDSTPQVGSSAPTAFDEVEALINDEPPYTGRFVSSEPLLQADFHNSAGDGHFGINHPVPGLFGNDDDFAIEITGTLEVIVAGDYTFVYQGDDGGRIQIDFNDGNGLVDVIQDTAVLHAEEDWGALVTFPASGDYEFRCVAFERGGGATFEWMYAQGDHTLDFTNGAFNTAQPGGTPIGDNVPFPNPGPWYLLGDPLPDSANPGNSAIEVADAFVSSFESPTVFGTTDLSSWDPSYPLGLGDEITVGGRKFNGEYFLVAIYDRALSPEEVSRNFEETEFSPCLPQVERSLDPDSYEPDDEVVVTLEATNLLAETTITDTFPAGWPVAQAGGGEVAGNTITFTAAGDATFTYVLTAARDLGATFSGRVTAEPGGCEPVDSPVGGESVLARIPPDPPGEIPGAVAQDLGFPAIPGTQELASEDPLEINLWASGADIWGIADEGRMVSFGPFEEFDIQATVDFFGRHDWGKAGLMARADIDDPGSPYAFLHITGANGTDFQFRDDIGFNAANRGPTGAAGIQRELRLLRRDGTLIEAFARIPGEDRWQSFAGRDIPALEGSLVGLAMTSHDNNELAAATFHGVTISTEPPPRLGTVADLSCSFGEDRVELSFTPPAGAAEIEIRRDGELVTTLAGDATDYVDTEGSASTAFGYSVTPYDATGLAGESATCAQERLLLLYDFEEGDGAVVHDRSGFEPAHDLVVQDPAFAEWGDGYLSVNRGLGTTNLGGTIISSPGVPAEKLFEVIQATKQVTVEAWAAFERDDFTANPTRLATYSDPANGPGNRHFTVGSLNNQFAARFRSTTNGTNGAGGPGGQLLGGFVLPEVVQHIVFTRAADGQETLWVDGEVAVTRPRTGDLSNWPDLGGALYEFSLAQEHGLERRWAGDLHRVAVYNYALSDEEVLEHFDAGPDDEPPAGGFVRGDADSNGAINITDAIRILSWLFIGAEEPQCLDAADTDDSGSHNLTDAVRILSWLFIGGLGPAPPAPSRTDYPPEDCGMDGGGASLGCLESSPTCEP